MSRIRATSFVAAAAGAVIVLAGCAPTPAPAPAPTVTVTVTATPAPPAPAPTTETPVVRGCTDPLVAALSAYGADPQASSPSLVQLPGGFSSLFDGGCAVLVQIDGNAYDVVAVTNGKSMDDLVAALKDAPGGAFDVEAFAGGGYTLSWYQSSGTTYLVPASVSPIDGVSPDAVAAIIGADTPVLFSALQGG